MGNGGTEFDSNDIFDNLRLNQKTKFIGNENQILDIDITYAGQEAMSTNSDSTYLREKKLIRNSANNAWSLQRVHTTTGSVGTHSISSSGAPNLQGEKIYCLDLTLPTSEKFYIISDFQFSISSSATPTGIVGADLLNGNHSTLLALGAFTFVTTGTRNIKCMSKPIRGGTTISPWISGDNSAVCAVRQNTPFTRRRKIGGWNAAPDYGEDLAITTTASTSIPGIRVNYIGYS